MRGHLLDLDLVEGAGASNEVLLGVALEHLVSEGIRLEKFRWVFNCVERKRDGNFIGVGEELAGLIDEADLEPELLGDVT